MARESGDEQEKKDDGNCFVKHLPTILSIFLPLVAYSVLISRVASFSSDLSFTISNNATSFSMGVQEATKEDISNYILLYWYDNMFIVPFGIFMAASLNAVSLPTVLKRFMLCTTIPAHPICDWIENTAAIMAYISTTESKDQMVDEYWLKQYNIWTNFKWTFLAINTVVVIFGFLRSMKKRFCTKA